MTCDYCGKATGAEARWEVSTGSPGDGMTRYPCDQHLPAACGHVGQVGEVRVFAYNRGCRHQEPERVGDIARRLINPLGLVAA